MATSMPDQTISKNSALRPGPDDGAYKALKFITKSLASLVPGFGGTASELFDLLIADPASVRRDRFIEDLARRLDQLTETGRIDPRSLINDPSVSALLLHAVQIATRSEGEEKIKSLREAAARGTMAANEMERSPAYVVIGIIDRLTDYHIILLKWKAGPPRSYTYGQVKNGAFDNLHFGLPTVADRHQLKEPHKVFDFEGVVRYVEAQSHRNFMLAEADLIALGLLAPVLKKETYVDERRRTQTRTTPEVASYKVSELARFILSYIESTLEEDVS